MCMMTRDYSEGEWGIEPPALTWVPDDNKCLGSPVNKYAADLPGKAPPHERELILSHQV